MVTSADVRELAGRLLTDELVVLPVRHHSPACALHVRRAIADLRPSAVLVEGPRSFDPLIPLLAHPEATMPLSVYTWFSRKAKGDEPEVRASAYYPFCDYSPELVALRDAAEHGIPARFIDLDFAEQHAVERPWAPSDSGRSLLDEHHFEHSRGLQLLAERLGCHDQEDLWERLFETREKSREEHVAAVTAYCLLARRDHTDAMLAAEGTIAREAEMAHHVRAALAERKPGDGPVLVVVGGFHAVVLPDLVATPPKRPKVRLAGVAADAALIRYTFERLDRLNGYASGMTSPAWHQLLWEHLSDDRADPRVAATLVALLDISRELRTRFRMPVAVPTVSAAFGQALQLAELRDRGAPLRSDLLDAILSCFVKGEVEVEGALVRAAARRVLTGTRVGVVPPGAGTPPIVADTLARLKVQRLKVDAPDRQVCSLDIYRRAAHRQTSRLLHGLTLLGVPFATRTAGPDFVHGTGLGRLQERWDYHWSPAVEGALVEAGVLGSTLPEAVAAKFAQMLGEHRSSGERRDSGAAVALLAQACVVGLHDRVDDALDLVRTGITVDESFAGVAAAASQLGLLWESREPLEARQLDQLPALLRTTYERAIFLGRELRGQECPPADAARALMRLRELLVSEAGEQLDAGLYWAMVEHLRHEHDVPFVRGAATGLCSSVGRIDDEALAVVVSGHLAGTISPEEAVGFLGGLLLTAREAAWQQPDLLKGLDARLRAWDDATFVRHLPELRLAFATMTPLETDRIAESVAALHGLGDLGSLLHRDVAEDDVRHHLEVSGRVAALLAADGLADWGVSR